MNMRQDITAHDEIDELVSRRREVSKIVKRRNLEGLEPATDALETSISRVMPARRFALIREYVEILAVALGVAMGCRAYFIQPYKIPTGSMQPTLYGITYQSREKPGILDRMPLKVFKWIITGEWYSEIRAEATGKISKVLIRRIRRWCVPGA